MSKVLVTAEVRIYPALVRDEAAKRKGMMRPTWPLFCVKVRSTTGRRKKPF